MHDPDFTLQDSFDTLLAQFDPGGRDFERLAGWFLVNDPEYAAIFERVWAWNDWPGCWGPDKGIDLIGGTRDGRIVAIQAKNYAERYSITKHDVDTFLSESARAEIDERLLIATTDRVAPTAVEVMDGQEKKVSRCLRTRLADARLQWPTSPAELLSAAASHQRIRVPIRTRPSRGSARSPEPGIGHRSSWRVGPARRSPPSVPLMFWKAN